MNDIVSNKKERIERCIKQTRTYYQLPASVAFEKDSLRQDAIAMNLQRLRALHRPGKPYHQSEKGWLS